MAKTDLTNRIQNSQTIWHETHSLPGQDRKSELALFQGQMVLANGETAACAGIEVINVTDDESPFAGRLMVLLADGSVSTQTFEGIVTLKESETRFSGTGTWQSVNGTGRFADLRGGGSFKWIMDGDSYHSEYGT